jgi:hypothetical protein
MTLPYALNIAGSDVLSFRQTPANLKSQRSASTFTSGYISNDSNNFSNSTKEDKKSKSKDKEKSWKEKIGRRRGSRPFRRAKTIIDSK